jgi:maltooligosyltrehalose trehalohydrolase
MSHGWQLEMGARVLDGGRVRFCVWAPVAERVEVELYPWPDGNVLYSMTRDGNGIWSAELDSGPGALYRYRVDGEWSYPDPCSRSQPEGVHGPSQVVDPSFPWTDRDWIGVDRETLAVYELHVGTYTQEGTFDALIGQLDELRDLGITAIELMPVAEFPGRRNWGYDGVDLYAPGSVYGGPEGLRRLVDATHARGLGVILDVVYNHFGPDGNYLGSFSPHYFTDRYKTPWGDAVNFDGDESAFVRRFFIDNALYWLHEFHIDGLRIDATHRMYDEGPRHVLQELAETVAEHGPAERSSLLVAEDERNELRIILPRAEGGYGFDCLWVDDFHHSVHVLLTNEDRGYLKGYEGTADEIARLLRVGFLYFTPPDAGDQPAGVAPALPARQLVYFMQNHDQIGNRPFGRRLAQTVDLESAKAAIALELLSPCTPLIFMGSEFGSTKPFLYFTDHDGDLGRRVSEGRANEFRELWHDEDGESREPPDPQDEETFRRCILDLSEREQPLHREMYALHRELLRLRRSDPVLCVQDRWRLLAESPAPGVVAFERWDDDGRRRLVAVNFGEAFELSLDAQAWLGDARALSWQAVLSTAEQRFAGPGCDLGGLALRPGAAVNFPARSAVLWQADDSGGT